MTDQLFQRHVERLVTVVGDRWLVAALLAALIFMALLIGWTNIQLGFPGQAG